MEIVANKIRVSWIAVDAICLEWLVKISALEIPAFANDAEIYLTKVE